MNTLLLVAQTLATQNSALTPPVKLLIDLLTSHNITVECTDQLPSANRIKNTQFLFIDATVITTQQLTKIIQDTYQSSLTIVIFNADHNDTALPLAALNNGVRGVIYAQDKSKLQAKAVKAILHGERWFCRAVLFDLIDQTIKLRIQDMQKVHLSESTLTNKELMITEQISLGAQNQEIADKLNISVNTVKTHIYSIFKKTQSRNRVELIRWYQQ